MKLFLLLILVVIAACLAVATKDPELKQCKHQCKVQQQFDEQQKRDCERSCHEYYTAKKEREKEEREREKWKGRHENDDDDEEEEYGKGGEDEGHPYVFDEEWFEGRVDTDEGKIWVLPKFTQRSKLLRGIENYRISILETNPLTFVSPTHVDAEILLFVVHGRGTVSIIKEKSKSFDLKPGDVFRIESGTPFYLINNHENEKLKIVNLLQPTSLPGHFQIFHGPGGENPESFYTAFSWELLEAALKIPSEKLKRFFTQQREGSIIKGSKEQIRSLSQHEEIIPRIWPFSESENERPFNLFKQHPRRSNKFGHLFEALHYQFHHLQDLNVDVCFANITRGSMVTPHYNSKSTTIAVVVDGEGRLEMACPHMSSSRTTGRPSHHGGGRWSESTYQKIRGRLRRGVVFIVPAGHPFATLASPNHNLQILSFQINAHLNVKFLLAGKENIVSKMEMMAKEMGFNAPGKEVERMFRQQDEEFFLPGPTRQEEFGRAYA